MEIPLLKELWSDIEQNSQVNFVAVATSDQKPATLDAIQKHQIPYPVVFDEDGELGYKYGVVGLPFLVITHKGKRLAAIPGALTTAKVERIKEILDSAH